MKLGRTLLFAAVCAALSFSCMEAKAADGDCWVMLPVEKLGRGIANAAFGALEIPIAWWDVQQDQGGIAGLTYGTFRGIALCIAREVVGVVEIATFPCPLPGCPESEDDFGWGYGPIMRPAWVVDVGHDWNNFVYDRDNMVSTR